MYSIDDRKEFNFRFLRSAGEAEVLLVAPKTHYNWRGEQNVHDHPECLELRLHLPDHLLVLGNLPIELLVPQEDFPISGFGVGILGSSGIAERRHYLIHEGPPPSFAYLCQQIDQRLMGINSHEYGIEQVFIRTHVDDSSPWWEVTITSFERIVDIVKYRVDIPAPLVERLQRSAAVYVSPLYRTYRDDNLR